MKRRSFVKDLAYTSAGLAIMGTLACNKTGQDSGSTATTMKSEPFFQLSLAQWSLNKAIREGNMDPKDFAKKAAELGFKGLEYVNHLYNSEFAGSSNILSSISSLVSTLNTNAKDNGVENLIMMVDEQQDLAVRDRAARKQGIEDHKKWIDMANGLGCHTVRTNLFGFDGSAEERADWGADALMRLCEYAKPLGMNVVIENHGYLSSDPNWLTGVIKSVNMDNCGILPDFGNFCLNRKDGAKWGECVEEYDDPYGAIKMMMPYAKGVSAKSYAFDEAGNETKIDFVKMMQIVKDAGYKGYVGVEYEGDIDEEQGIAKTKELLLKVVDQLT